METNAVLRITKIIVLCFTFEFQNDILYRFDSLSSRRFKLASNWLIEQIQTCIAQLSISTFMIRLKNEKSSCPLNYQHPSFTFQAASRGRIPTPVTPNLLVFYCVSCLSHNCYRIPAFEEGFLFVFFTRTHTHVPPRDRKHTYVWQAQSNERDGRLPVLLFYVVREKSMETDVEIRASRDCLSSEKPHSLSLSLLSYDVVKKRGKEPRRNKSGWNAADCRQF